MIRINPRNSKMLTGSILLALFLLVALLSLRWTPFKLDDMSGGRLSSPSWQHLLGTDTLGRDQLSRVMIGARIAIEVGFSAVLIGILIGLSLIHI